MKVSDFCFWAFFVVCVFFSVVFSKQKRVAVWLSKPLAVIRNNRRFGEQLSQKCCQQQRYCVMQQLNVWHKLSVQNNIYTYLIHSDVSTVAVSLQEAQL